ncbi:MAG TPA: tetratricopeptide repeat protein [Isosphaeraceae bacterium]
MPTIADALAVARRHYQAGGYFEAGQICRQILQVDSGQADAWFLLGSAEQSWGRVDEAAAAYRRALELRPDYVEALNSLGIALKARGELDEAVASYRRALELRPDYAIAANNLGNALKARGKLDEAVAAYRRALELRPDYAMASSNLGAALFEQGRAEEAIAALRHALELMPGSAEAHNNLGVALRDRGGLDEAEAHVREALRLQPDFVPAHNNLGTILRKQGRWDEAVAGFRRALELQPESAEALVNLADALQARGRWDEAEAGYRRAVQLRPDSAEAHHGLGLALLERGRLEEAAAGFRQALRIRPGFAAALNGLGNALTELGELDEAAACYERALEQDPDLTAAHNNLGQARARQGRPDEALASFQRALELEPDSVDAHFNRSLVWLLTGDFERGWPEYEWRWRRSDAPIRPHPQPPWDGSPLDGRTILLHEEQGWGDTLQFIRYAALVKRRGGQVVVEVPGSLIPLLAGCAGIDRLVATGAEPPPVDVQAPLMSLPRILGTPPAPFPADVPYLVADDRLVERWRRELDALGGFKVGIAWQGNPRHPGSRQRSIPLGEFAPLAGIEGVRLLSLQKGPGAEQLREAEGLFPVVDLGPGLDEASGAFMDTAAVMKGLDLVISCDTAVAHLAGALGVPTWVALSSAPDWRWLLDREDSPWYPTLRLFRQWPDEPGRWGPVFERMAAELEALRKTTARMRPIRVEISPGELLDKISILQIKAQRFDDPGQLAHVRAELASLEAARDAALGRQPPALPGLAAELKAVNDLLWLVEDEIRLCERNADFGPHFIELARAVYHQNDRRAAIKRQINELLRSELIEEKAYTPYG